MKYIKRNNGGVVKQQLPNTVTIRQYRAKQEPLTIIQLAKLLVFGR